MKVIYISKALTEHALSLVFHEITTIIISEIFTMTRRRLSVVYNAIAEPKETVEKER